MTALTDLTDCVVVYADENMILGQGNGGSLTTGTDNTALGDGALTDVTEGSDNVAIGASALSSITTQNGNTAVGSGALSGLSLSSASTENVAVGYQAMSSATSGNHNTCLGAQTSLANGTGNNTLVGSGASGYASHLVAIGASSSVTDGGEGSIAIGYGTTVSSSSSNSIAIGYQTTVTTNNTVQLGNNTTTDVYLGDAGTNLGTDLNLLGDPTTTTQSPGDNSTKIATTAYVDAAVAGGSAVSPTGFFSNLKADVTGNTAATVSADLVVMTNDSGVSVAKAISSTLDLSGTGLNKLDTGSLASSTWYYLWAVSDGSTSGVVASTSSSAPDSSITSSYPYYARLPATLRTNGSTHLMATRARGRKNQYVVGGTNVSAYPTIATGAAGTFTSGVVTAWSSQSVASVIPTAVAASIAIILEQGFNLSAYVSPNNSTAPAYTANSSNPAWGGGQGGSLGNQFQHVEFVLESTNVYYAGYGTGSGIYCVGWDDNL